MVLCKMGLEFNMATFSKMISNPSSTLNSFWPIFKAHTISTYGISLATRRWIRIVSYWISLITLKLLHQAIQKIQARPESLCIRKMATSTLDASRMARSMIPMLYFTLITLSMKGHLLMISRMDLAQLLLSIHNVSIISKLRKTWDCRQYINLKACS